MKGLPVPLESCSGVFASHVLEHLSLSDFRIALNNTYHLLQNQGIFRLIVPDLEVLAKKYIQSQEATAAEMFMRETSLGFETRQKGLKGLLQFQMGNSSHLWMWDHKSLEQELAAVGFVNIRRCVFGDSPDPMFKLVEDPGRFTDAVAIESRKP